MRPARLFLVLGLLLAPTFAQETLKVTVIAVGQGDAGC
jgi:hypothetical protein